MDATSLFFLEKQMLIVCSLFLLSLTSQVLDGLPRVLAFDINTVSSFFWHSGRVILPWCQLKLVYVNTCAYQWKICYGLIEISMLVTKDKNNVSLTNMLSTNFCELSWLLFSSIFFPQNSDWTNLFSETHSKQMLSTTNGNAMIISLGSYHVW